MSTYQAVGLASQDTTGVLKRMTFARREPKETDVKIEVHYCGICHSDLHQIRGEWDQSVFYPMIPGHEIVGIVQEVGDKVTKFKVGQRVGVGCMVDSCGDCVNCKNGLEQHCKRGMDATYNCCVADKERININNSPEGELLFGGYSSHITVTEHFVVSIPDNLPLDQCAPLLCAGITTYSPLVHYGGVAKGIFGKEQLNVGVAGFGGLGHCCVKIAKAMGHHVTVISRSEGKRAAALAMGADEFVVTANKQQMSEVEGTLHLIIDTIAADHNVNPMLSDMVATGGVVCLVGIPPLPVPVKGFAIIGNRSAFAGSLIGGMQETQEMLDFCSKHNILPDVEMIDAKSVNQKIHELYKNKNSSRRFVIRIKDTLAPQLTNNAWETADEPEINPSDWRVNPNAKIVPASADYHANTLNKKSCPVNSNSLLAAAGVAVVVAAVVYAVKRD